MKKPEIDDHEPKSRNSTRGKRIDDVREAQRDIEDRIKELENEIRENPGSDEMPKLEVQLEQAKKCRNELGYKGREKVKGREGQKAKDLARNHIKNALMRMPDKAAREYIMLHKKQEGGNFYYSPPD